ncbi:MAG: efflux RND transporter permease subunit [Zavarzinella sp.]
MLNQIIRLALNHRTMVVIIAVIAMVWGTIQALQMPIDVFPNLDRPRVTIITEAPGYATEEVETLITFPLESAILGGNGVVDVRSQSGPGVSVIFVEFGWDAQAMQARQVVQERIATAIADLPERIQPHIAPASSLMGQFMIFGIHERAGPSGGKLSTVEGTSWVVEEQKSLNETNSFICWDTHNKLELAEWTKIPSAQVDLLPTASGDRLTGRVVFNKQSMQFHFSGTEKAEMEIRTLVDWQVRPRLQKIPGMAQVIPMGGGRKQYQVLLDPDALHQYEVTLSEVQQALESNNANFSGGLLHLNGSDQPVRILGRLGENAPEVLENIRKIPVKVTEKRSILIEQIAFVKEGIPVKVGDVSVNGTPGISLSLTRQTQADTREITKAALNEIKQIQTTLPPHLTVDTDIYQMRDFIDRGIFNVLEALIIGALLVTLVLFLFLLNWRTTIISLTAIPMSLVITTIIFYFSGILFDSNLSINVMTLGGIAVALGELVDDAIVDVENIYRRLNENSMLDKPRSRLLVVFEASKEVRSAIVFGTMMVILVFLPLLALSGMEGRLFSPLAVAYVTAILSSLLVSLTLTPVMAYWLLVRTGGSQTTHHADNLVVRNLKFVATLLVRFSLKYAGWLLLLTWILVGYFGLRLFQLKSNFLPAFDEGTVQLNISLTPGASLDASNQTCSAIDEHLLKLQANSEHPDFPIRGFLRRTGRAELDEHVEPTSATEYLLMVNPDNPMPRQELLDLLTEKVKEVAPEVGIEAEQPLAHLISHMLSGTTAQIAIKIYGDDLDLLLRKATDIQRELAEIPGIKSLAVEPIRRTDEVHIRLRPDALQFYGLDKETIGKYLEIALRGKRASQVIEGQKRFDLIVRFHEEHRKDISSFGRLRIDIPNHHREVLLQDIADITPATGGDSGANQVKRDNTLRRMVVRCNADTTQRTLQAVVEDIQRTVATKINMPAGYYVEYAGQFENQRAASRQILLLGIASLVGMFLVLFIAFPSIRIVLQLFNAIPTAFIGGVLALLITGQKPSLAAWVGFISLGGIAMRNGILLITHYIHLMKHEGEGFTPQMIVRGSMERLSPVLMTSLTAGIGLLPLVIAGNLPGREILYPVATVITGGLITSTFCEFLLHPGIFWKFSGKSVTMLTTQATDVEKLV